MRRYPVSPNPAPINPSHFSENPESAAFDDRFVPLLLRSVNPK